MPRIESCQEILAPVTVGNRLHRPVGEWIDGLGAALMRTVFAFGSLPIVNTRNREVRQSLTSQAKGSLLSDWVLEKLCRMFFGL